MATLPPILPARRRRDPDQPRLSGLLAIIFWCACGITAVPLAGMFSLIAVLGTQGALSAIADSLSGDAVATQILRLGLVPQALLFIWGASFVVLTIMRAASARTIAPWLLLAWMLGTAGAQFAIRSLLTPDGVTVGDFAALLPGLLAQAVGAAAFWGYMKEAERPRRYFVR